MAKDLLCRPGRRYRLAKQSIDRCPTDLETLGDVRWTEALIPENAHLLWVDAGLTALVDARYLGLADTLQLTLAAKVGLELRQDPEHVEEIWWAAFLQQYQQGGYLNICMHPFVSGRALRIAMLDRLIERMKRLPGVWFPTCEQVAHHVLANHPAH